MGLTRIGKDELVARARLRHQLRLFERSSEEACAQAGITLPQYLLLLQVAGRPGRSWALVGELADCLVLRHHTTVELVGRCEAAGLAERERDPQDHRKVRVRLTPTGARIVARIASGHAAELERLGEHVQRALQVEPGAGATSASAAVPPPGPASARRGRARASPAP